MDDRPLPVPDAPALLRRRAFLGRLAAGLGATAVLAACGAGAGTEAASCEGHDALTEQELQVRHALRYVDETTTPESRCDTCRFYAAREGSPCGGCQVLPGPVAPGGYCTSWAPPAA